MKLTDNIIRNMVHEALNEIVRERCTKHNKRNFDIDFLKQLQYIAKRKASNILDDYCDKVYGDDYDDEINFSINKIIMVPINGVWYRCFTRLSMSVEGYYEEDVNYYGEIHQCEMRISKIIEEKTKEVVYDMHTCADRNINRLMFVYWKH